MTAQYKTIADCFIAPYFVKKGSIIETGASPGPHLEPMNDEARSAFEAWYDEEIPEIDVKTKLPAKNVDGSLVMWKPHANYRTAVYMPTEAATVKLISEPAADDMTGTLDLASARFSQPGNGELRPAPDPVYAATPRGEDGTVILPAPIPKPAIKVG